MLSKRNLKDALNVRTGQNESVDYLEVDCYVHASDVFKHRHRRQYVPPNHLLIDNVLSRAEWEHD